MNAYQRVMNSLKGLPVDRPPVLAVLGAYGGKLTGTPLPELYTDADKFVAGQQAVIDTFKIDMVLSTLDFSLIAEAFGGQIVFFDDQPPNMKRPAAANIKEALALPLPDRNQPAGCRSRWRRPGNWLRSIKNAYRFLPQCPAHPHCPS